MCQVSSGVLDFHYVPDNVQLLFAGKMPSGDYCVVFADKKVEKIEGDSSCRKLVSAKIGIAKEEGQTLRLIEAEGWRYLCNNGIGGAVIAAEIGEIIFSENSLNSKATLNGLPFEKVFYAEECG